MLTLKAERRELSTELSTAALGNNGGVITPTLTLEASPAVVSQGETFELYGKLSIKEAGDLNEDGIINVLDLLKIAYVFGAREGDPNYDPSLDLNKDGVINVLDLLKIASVYGQTAASKPIEIQFYREGYWVPLLHVTTESDGSFRVSVEATGPPGVYYFRAYFPGGEYQA